MPQKIAILGFGREGRSLLKFIEKRPNDYKNREVWILDKNPKTKTPKKIKAKLGDRYLSNLNKFDLIFRSPGVPLWKIKTKGLKPKNKISSAAELFFNHCPCPIIGVTGTKGKGTTATLIYKILKNCGRDVYLAGNIGTSPLEILPSLKKSSLVVLELSSFQLQDLKKSPQIAVILNIFPDHMDVHKNFKEYINAKSAIAKFQKPENKVFYFSDDKLSSWMAKKSQGKKISISNYLTVAEQKKLRKIISLSGKHNWLNIQAAAAVAKFLKSDIKKSLETIKKFKGNEHRLEFVKKINGVKFYNDSASTNPQTTIAAIRAFKEPKILIAGGSDKGLDYGDWEKNCLENNVKAIILMGENKNKITKALDDLKNIKIEKVYSLKQAIKTALKIAKSGDILLFSPGAASFDMFKDYKDRGQKFKKLVKSL